MATPVGKVLSVNVGSVREFEYGGRPARSAIWKSPAVGRIAARGVNLAGDGQADRKAHGGPDKAVYAYAVEDVRWWEQKIGQSLAYGEFGFTEALRPGAYLRIVVEGNVGAGDEIRVVERPDHDLRIRDVFRIYTRDRDEAGQLLVVPQMSESWRRWANDGVQKAKGRPMDVAEPGCC